MWHFSVQGLPGIAVTNNTRELLPHVFTLIRQWRTVIFCGTFCWWRATTRLFTGTPPCAVRTFLLPLLESDDPNRSRGEDTKEEESSKWGVGSWYGDLKKNHLFHVKFASSSGFILN